MAAIADSSAMLPSVPSSHMNGSASQRPRKPNYYKLHELPLPLKTYPLPSIILHNPLSLVGAALYYISEIISRPLGVVTSHERIPYKGYFSSETRSVHVTDPATIRALWEKGFFGKGNLSRSEPTWLAREKAKRHAAEGNTSEEATRKRREERRQFKNERALKEREAIEQKLKEEGKLEKLQTLAPVDEVGVNGFANGNIRIDMNGYINQADHGQEKESINGVKTVRFSPTVEHISSPLDKVKAAPIKSRTKARIDKDSPIEIQEHLQLTLEEAFFLAYGLGVLAVFDLHTTEIMQTDTMLSAFNAHSYFPPRIGTIQPDDRFMLSYVAYHHFRSLGWVVRSGVKFAADYLLYQRGPVFAHAEFAVIVLPSYTDPYWRSDPVRAANVSKKESKAWWWLHGVNRVQSQVRKSLILVYIDVPAPLEEGSQDEEQKSSDVFDITKLLGRYSVREISLKRWIPNRSRD